MKASGRHMKRNCTNGMTMNVFAAGMIDLIGEIQD